MVLSIVSYSVEVLNNNKELRSIVKNTNDLFNDALNYLCDVVDENYEDIKGLKSLEARMYLEHLVHNTKNNIAKYDFDSKFYKLPAYLLRDIETKAIGHISSYYANLANYHNERYNAISNGKKYKKKEIQKGKCNMLPTFYKNNMYLDKGNIISLKLYIDNTWKYIDIKLKKRDLNYISKISGKRLNPQIYIEGKKIFVKFIFEQADIKLTNKSLNKTLICGVDLGINNDATLSIMDAKGTIVGRHFVNNPTDKDRLNHLLNKKKKIQRQSGNYKYVGNLHIVNKINSINKNIVNQVVSKIIMICLSYGVDVIVFENLRHKFKRAKKTYRERFNHWKKVAVFNKALEMAHRNGMHISTVNPAGTSKNAYDGSGEVKRSKSNYSICEFTNGKIYNCDLSASYNIAARYLIREYLKPLDENSRLALETKVSLKLSGTTVTYNTLRTLLNVIN